MLDTDGTNAINVIKTSLDGLNVDEAVKKLNDLKINPSLAVDILNAANDADLLAGSVDEVSNGIKKVSKESVGIGTAFKGLGRSIVNFVTNPVTIGSLFC